MIRVDADRGINIRIRLGQLAYAREILERHRHAQRALDLVLAHQIEHRIELAGKFGKIDVAVRINQHVRLPAIHRVSMLHTTAAIVR